jgi:hypothetical protein
VTRTYLQSDAEPSADTFIGHVAPAPQDAIVDAIARAHAARAALRELDGKLPEQPLAVTVRRTETGAIAEPSELDVAAFAIGDRVVRVRLAARIEDEAPLAAALAGGTRLDEPHATPFVTVCIGDEPIETARHSHRRAWRRNGVAVGPWLGLSRAGALATVSTCHMIVDGYGHAWLAAKIAEHTAQLAARADRRAHAPGRDLLPVLAPVDGARSLDVAWRPLDAPAPRALPLAYALGRLLHHTAGRAGARRSPFFQIPVAPGSPGDPRRRLRRVVPAIASVRFAAGAAEPFDAFAARTERLLAREAAGAGMVSRLIDAARSVPAPLAWKRAAVGADRPRWLEPIADLLGGRGCATRIRLDEPTPPACAVSSPPSHSGFVVTIVGDGQRSAVTLCGSGASDDLLDRLIALLPTSP